MVKNAPTSSSTNSSLGVRGRGGRRGGRGRGRGSAHRHASARGRRRPADTGRLQVASSSTGEASINDSLQRVEATVNSRGEELSSASEAAAFVQSLLSLPIFSVLSILNTDNGHHTIQNALSIDDSEMFLSIVVHLLDKLRVDGMVGVVRRPLTVRVLFNVFTAPRVPSLFSTLSAQGLLLPISSCLLLLADAELSEQVASVVRNNDECQQLAVHCCEVLSSVFEHISLVQELRGLFSCNSRPNHSAASAPEPEFRSIRLMPTVAELKQDVSLDRFKTSTEHDDYSVLARHFHLLREDFMAALREQWGSSTAQRSLHGVQLRSVIADAASPGGGHSSRMAGSGQSPRRLPLSRVRVSFRQPKEAGSTVIARRSFWEQSSLLAEGSLVAFCSDDKSEMYMAEVYKRDVHDLGGHDDDTIIGFVTVRFVDDHVLRAVLPLLTHTPNMSIVPVCASFFAFRPVLLRLQRMSFIPLGDVLFRGAVNTPPQTTHANDTVRSLVSFVKTATSSTDLRSTFGFDKRTEALTLDEAQRRALVHALEHQVALIQGPPGTGKSFVGALIGEILRRHTSETVLVITCTNHALDQFLEDLLDMGVPRGEVVRVGGHAENVSERVRSLMLFGGDQRRKAMPKLTKIDNDEIKAERDRAEAEREKHRQTIIKCEQSLKRTFQEYGELSKAMNDAQRRAFERIVDERSRFVVAGTESLWKKWCAGDKLDKALREQLQDEHKLWSMKVSQRRAQRQRWAHVASEPVRVKLIEAIEAYDWWAERLRQVSSEKNERIVRAARVIACTTTCAAKYGRLLEAAQPGVVLVEEAGEILEAHVLTALRGSCQHLIMIGDHEQLRPKVNARHLSVESGSGLDWNRSLFERLVAEDGERFDKVTLQSQRRMHPDMSACIRELTPSYAELCDHSSVSLYPTIPGVAGRFVWLNHNEPERDHKRLRDRRAPQQASKVNDHEVGMCIAIVRHLLRQESVRSGATTMTILTPYVAQLRELTAAMQTEEFTAFVNELDGAEFRAAGHNSPLLTATPEQASGVAPPPVRVATIDSFQGEESDIVIVSLVRSNARGVTGFLKERQRVNVLLSRARHGAIILGNRRTFTHAREWRDKASSKDEATREIWRTVCRHVQHCDKLPLYCEQHQCTSGLVSVPDDFDAVAPRGGCMTTCLHRFDSCGHTCMQRCHTVDREHVGQYACETCRELLLLEEEIAQENRERRVKAERAKMEGDRVRLELEAKLEQLRARKEAEVQHQRTIVQREIAKRTLNDEETKIRDELAAIRAQVDAWLHKLEEERREQELALAQKKEKAERTARQKLRDAERRQGEWRRRALADEAAVETDALLAESAACQCQICFDNVERYCAFRCRSDQCDAIACQDCFDDYVAEQARSSNAATLVNGRVCCFTCRTEIGTAHALEHAQGSGGTALLEAMKERNRDVGRKEETARREEEQRRRDELSAFDCAVTDARKRVEEAMLDSCPRCDRAFNEYEACAALRCSGEGGCGQYFCALCLESCENNQKCHAHVMKCEYNSEKELYVSEKLWRDCQRKRHARLVRYMLNSFDKDVRAEVEKATGALLFELET